MNDSGRSGVQDRELAHSVTIKNPQKHNAFDYGSIAALADACAHLRGQSRRAQSPFTLPLARQDAEESVPFRRKAPGISCP